MHGTIFSGKRNNKITEKLEIFIDPQATTSMYWDCNCDNDYIHPKATLLYCADCKAWEDEQPDSLIWEVAQWLLDCETEQKFPQGTIAYNISR